MEQQVVFPEEENARAQQNTEVEISNEYVKKAKIVDGVFPKLIKLHQGWENLYQSKYGEVGRISKTHESLHHLS